ncbi:MAG TPA: carbamoyltransferase HypF [Thermoanaerobaculia bacterium]|nr:carbamoyltransferase HypF [Thermoanaerobaculia bacterium]
MERRSIAVRGIVQGVGFRPFVYGLAGRLGLGGSVRNRPGEVVIEVEGPATALDSFLHALAESAPPLAQIDELSWRPAPLRGEPHFSIVASEVVESGASALSPDVAPCERCVSELHDPRDRRHGYAFLNCTSCGPRLTIALSTPYDRARTTMAGFALCAACRREYEDPADRRFHAQPIGCPECGPRLAWIGADDEAAEEPLAAAVRTLREGGIVAVKGPGGFQLACDAASDSAVARLRAGKERGGKPFALLVADVPAARALCVLDAVAERLLTSAERPVVLLPRRPAGSGPRIAAGVAPGGALLGLLLPPSPLHFLLLDHFPGPLVLTSGNRGGEPMAIDDEAARRALAGLADGLLGHDRPIALRCDDSVVRWSGRRPIPIRRSRGSVPRPLRVGTMASRPVLALGGHEKNTFCMLREEQAVLSHHIGDLDTVDAVRDLRAAIDHYRDLLGLAPAVVACDLHPDYASTAIAYELAARDGLELLPVQHHHAHALTVAAENRVDGPLLGIVLDGSGLGTDGTVWGCELLAVDGARMERVGHLETVALPGGEAAVREPWRMAVSWLLAAFGELPALDLPPLAVEPGRVAAVERLVRSGVRSPPTSSAGRLFDAVAALLGLCQRVTFEGQAAMQLEAIARPGAERPYPFSIEAGEGPFVLRVTPTLCAVASEAAAGGDRAAIAARFHRTLVCALVDGARLARERHGLERVALSGGCFQNALLLESLHAALSEAGFTVLLPLTVPPNDGGLSLGQAVAAAQLEGGRPCA